MQKVITGKAYVLGENIDTDQIIPAQYLVYSLKDPQERKMYGQYALSSVPEGKQGLPQGNVPFIQPGKNRSEFGIIVAGTNFGCGSSREHAPFALREAGVQAVIAPFYARIFYRNTVDGGFLVPFECPDGHLNQKVRTGDELEIDAEQCTVKNLTQKTAYSVKPLGDIKAILEAGDIFEYAKKTGMAGKAKK
jgi:3-isopropylmalate/(R)-2-methylmalate dehydratase small subunit